MNTRRTIESIAVIGSGTMGMGIAALAAERGCKVLLLDISTELADAAVERMQAGRSPVLSDQESLKRISTGSTESDFEKIADYDLICEVVKEDLATKREIFEQIEALRSEGSIVTTNTSGIPLKAITDGMPDRLRADIAVTHFFNPVKIMRLLELVPGKNTDPAVIDALTHFGRHTLGKGVVHAKDTVNFIGNRIGCMWMLYGLHRGQQAREDGLSIETIDALLSEPVGLPPTGLYGLVDLVGLDIMDLVAKNLEENLPKGDAGREWASLPTREQAMLARQQLGRKTGGGYYRVKKDEDGGKLKEAFDLEGSKWRATEPVSLSEQHSEFVSLLSSDDTYGQFAWDVMSNMFFYAADLVPEISEDIVNIDRAMQWGFNWALGPFQMIDQIGLSAVLERLEADDRSTPAMIKVLRESGATRFYRADGAEFLGVDGHYHPMPEA